MNLFSFVVCLLSQLLRYWSSSLQPFCVFQIQKNMFTLFSHQIFSNYLTLSASTCIYCSCHFHRLVYQCSHDNIAVCFVLNILTYLFSDSFFRNMLFGSLTGQYKKEQTLCSLDTIREQGHQYGEDQYYCNKFQIGMF